MLLLNFHFQSAATFAEWKNGNVNIIDTPGMFLRYTVYDLNLLNICRTRN